ncbi:hypothetical protein QJS10_CPB15g00530 [Acorus calamus]|uniref:Uncharacterized protein n=1 Tax=Acorus calamus TaxID=4465 RepID=A0AAV9DCJ9_ACOCL|nr:hypothetical protein QJS10_CPB15g00530 [Acorus calamus]
MSVVLSTEGKPFFLQRSNSKQSRSFLKDTLPRRITYMEKMQKRLKFKKVIEENLRLCTLLDSKEAQLDVPDFKDECSALSSPLLVLL